MEKIKFLGAVCDKLKNGLYDVLSYFGSARVALGNRKALADEILKSKNSDFSKLKEFEELINKLKNNDLEKFKRALKDFEELINEAFKALESSKESKKYEEKKIKDCVLCEVMTF